MNTLRKWGTHPLCSPRKLGGIARDHPQFARQHRKIGGDSGKPPPDDASASQLKSLRNKLRERHFVASGQVEKKRLAEPDAIRACANELRELTSRRKRIHNAPETLERLSKLGLDALNDAREIRANYPAGDDGMPTAPAPAGKPDIECRYNGFAAIWKSHS